jgi:hypothetical protein
MPDFIAMSLSNRVPGRTPNVPAIEPLAKFRRADYSNLTAAALKTARADLLLGVQNRTAVADIAVKYSEITAGGPRHHRGDPRFPATPKAVKQQNRSLILAALSCK